MLLGLMLTFTPLGFDIEETYGLRWLFLMRGTRPAPSEVVIVGIDRHSGRALGLPDDIDDWPRTIHAELIRKLSKACARAIVFDIYFVKRNRETEDDDAILANAIQEAKNVVLVAHLSVRNDDEMPPLLSKVEEVRMPSDALSNMATAVAPFPLPNSPHGVTGYWTFKSSAGDTPTLPTVAFQIYAIQAYEEYRRLLEGTHVVAHLELPATGGEILATRGVIDLLERSKTLFQENPDLAEHMRNSVHEIDNFERRSLVTQIVETLLNLHQSGDWHYLNFYGPPRTIRTINYADVLRMPESINCEVERRYAGKVVFVGASELSPVEQKDKDVFDTVFSQATGLKLSGSEIAATATANLIDRSEIKRLNIASNLCIVVIFGLMISVCWRSLATLTALLLSLAFVAVYTTTACYQFARYGLWYPLVTPLTQSIIAIILALARNRNDVEARAAEIRRALKDWLPPVALEQLINSPGNIKRTRGLLYGTCIHTDLQGFTALSERVGPVELSQIMEEYFQVIGKPVTRHGGIVSDQIGDAMLAIWAASEPDIMLRKQACEGALDITDAVQEFSRKTGEHRFPTRIGLHAGRIAVGDVPPGALGQSRSFGSIINAAQRIQALNKVLSTRILLSEEVIGDLAGDFFIRPVGQFILVGLATPLTLYELLGRRQRRGDLAQQRSRSHPKRSQSPDLAWLCAAFSEALDDYCNMKWQAASQRFVEILAAYPGDGPSNFYLRRTEFYRNHALGGPWDPVIRT